MTDKKLTYKEIIKALECCFMEQQCNNCPLYKEHSVDCLDTVLENAHALITRLQAQNKDLSEMVHNLTLEKDALFDKAEELKADVERLNALVKTKNKLIEGLDQSISYAYDRAIKEFAEKLHEELRIYGIKDKFNKAVFLNVVDKAKKELVGEDK